MAQRDIAMETICSRAVQDPAGAVAQAERQYADLICELCRKALGHGSGRKILLLAGPSASGKTTTAHRIGQNLQSRGKYAAIVSLDNFYLDREFSPRFPDGRPDYESVNALDLPLMETVLRDFLDTGDCEMPVFDFSKGMRSPQTQKISLGKDDVIILEGLHALNPVIVDHLPREMLYKIYVSVGTAVTDGKGRVALGRKDIRFLRRLVRDDKFRDFDVNETFAVWATVMYGEKKYLVPFKETADMQINSFHAYEPCALAKESMALLQMVGQDSPHYKKAQQLLRVVSRFPEIKKQMLPENSLLREFLGH